MFQSLKSMLICMAFLALLTSCNDPKDKEEKYVTRGDALFAQKEYVKAKLEYKNAARISPTNPKIIYSLGLVEEAQGNITNALKAFLVAEQQDNNYAPAASKLLQYFMAAQRYDEVTKRVDHLLSIAPNDATAHAIKGSLFLRDKDFDQANAQIQKALDLDPANIIAYSVLAGVHSAQIEPDKAISALEKGIKKNPEEVSLRLLKAAIHSEQQNIAEVIKVYHELFELFPKETKFRFDLATVLSETGYIKEAESELREVVRLFSESVTAKHRLAIFLEENRDTNAAEKEIQSYIEKRPEDKIPYIWLADLYIRNNKDLLAIETLTNLISNEADDQISMNASTSLAHIQLRKGDLEIARRLIDSVLENDVNNKEALFVRANLSFYQGNNQQAVSDLRTIIRDDAKANKAHRVLAEVFLIQGHANLAMDTLVESLKTNPTELPNHVRLAQLYSLQGDNKRALELLNIVTKTDPSYPVGWENTARLAIDDKKWDDAENAIQRLEKLEGQILLAKFLRGQVLAKTEKYDQAKIIYMDVIKTAPSSPLAEYALSALLNVSQSKEGLQNMRSFLSSLETNNPTIAAVLGGVLMSMNEKDGAETYFKKAIENKPGTQAPYIAYAKLLIEKGNDDLALNVLSKAEKDIPYEVAASIEKANFLSMLGKTEDAISIYESLYKNNDQTDVVANNMAQLIADYKSHDKEAMENAKIAAERFANSDNPYYLDTLGWVYLRMGHTAQAQSVLERAIALSPKPLHPQIGYHYGALLAKIDRNEEAMTYLTQSLSRENASYPGIDDAKALLSTLKE